jgi:hypothetical protein
MKSQASFLVKGIYIILIVVAISMVLNQITDFRLYLAKEREELDLKIATRSTLETLTSSPDCLAYQESRQAGGKEIESNPYRLIDINKLENFTSKYSELEPECARNFNYRFQVKVEKFNQTRTILILPGDIPYPGNRDIVLIFDNSASMLGKKMAVAKEAANKLLDCADETDRLSIVTFREICDVDEKAPLTILTTKNKEQLKKIISAIDAKTGTPLINALKKSVDILNRESSQDRVRMIILMTDGRESCCSSCSNPGYPECLGLCDILCRDINSIVPQGIPVYAVGYYVDSAGEYQLNCTALKTGGKYYYADIRDLAKVFCRIVGGKITPEETEFWFFGVQDHSPGDALKLTASISTPVAIRMDENKIQPGLLTITAYKGELEQFSGIIDKVCLTGIEFYGQLFFSYPTYIKNVSNKNFVCMDYKNTESCLRLSCGAEIEFSKINPGSYKMRVKSEAGKIIVSV